MSKSDFVKEIIKILMNADYEKVRSAYYILLGMTGTAV